MRGSGFLALVRRSASSLAAIASNGSVAELIFEQMLYEHAARAAPSERRSWDRSIPVLANDLVEAGLVVVNDRNFARGIDIGQMDIGEVPGLGFKQTVGVLELGRINVAARGAGMASAALQAALRYSKQRHTMGKPIGQHQAIQIMLADMACRTASAKLLVRQAALAFDAGQRCDLEAGMAKLVASEAALANAISAMRIHGAYGYSTEFEVERYFRDAPLLCIGEGTNEIQRMVIARALLSSQEEAIRGMF